MGNGHAIATNQNANDLRISNSCGQPAMGKWKDRLLEIGKHIIHPRKWTLTRRHRAEKRAKEIIETAVHNAAAHKKLKVKTITPPDFLCDPKAAHAKQRKADIKAGNKNGLSQTTLRVTVKFGAAPFNIFMGLKHDVMEKEIVAEINAYLKSHGSHYRINEKGIVIGNDFVNKIETMYMTIDLKKNI